MTMDQLGLLDTHSIPLNITSSGTEKELELLTSALLVVKQVLSE